MDGIVAVIGLHVTVDRSGSSSNPNSYVSSTDGHAWLSVQAGKGTPVSTYGLYPDSHPFLEQFGYNTSRSKSDIRKDYEIALKRRARNSRYYGLLEGQYVQLSRLLKRNVRHRLTENCASWVAKTVRQVTGEHVKADEAILRFIETPRQIAKHIMIQEAKRKTSRDDPLLPVSLRLSDE